MNIQLTRQINENKTKTTQLSHFTYFVPKLGFYQKGCPVIKYNISVIHL